MPLGCDKQARCKVNVQSPEKHQSWQKKITQEAALEPALGKGPSHAPDLPRVFLIGENFVSISVY